jgi:hypothetical protein
MSNNPCINCGKSWSVDAKTSCHDTCEQFQLWRDGKNLSEYKNKSKTKFDAKIEETFKNNLDKWREEFVKRYELISNNDLFIIYKVFEFIKNKC